MTDTPRPPKIQRLSNNVEHVANRVAERADRVMLTRLRHFLRIEAAGGLLLILGTFLALICANTDLSHWYHEFMHTYIGISFGDWKLKLSLAHWVNDALMAIFFFVVGLEIKREIMEGELSSFSQAALPIVAAIGGIVVPASIFYYFTSADPMAVNGWAIPSATDIAFALGILSLFGKRVPLSLKLFLTAVAVMDDLVAIAIIGVFYSGDLDTDMLALAAAMIGVLLYFNFARSARIWIYLIFGLIMWYAVLKSGVHATLAGVTLGFLIPHDAFDRHGKRFANRLEHDLHPWVAFLILPIFAFVNAGVSFEGISMESFNHPVVLGITLGLFIGKQIGVFGASWVMIKCGLAKLPRNVNWGKFYATSALAGIGFTMSLFIGNLAYTTNDLQNYVKLGVLSGSLLSTIFGMLLLHFSLPKEAISDEERNVITEKE